MQFIERIEFLNADQMRDAWESYQWELVKGKRVELPKTDELYTKWRNSLKVTWIKMDIDTRRK